MEREHPPTFDSLPIKLSNGLAEEAYNRYAISATRKSTYLATFLAIVKKYPDKDPSEILRDLVASTPGEEGKWFAAARSIGLFDEAIELVKRSPCDPGTLTRAARDMVVSEPWFAVEAGMAALRWLAAGYGYDNTGMDVQAAFDHTMKAAENAGSTKETLERVHALVVSKGPDASYVEKVISSLLK